MNNDQLKNERDERQLAQQTAEALEAQDGRGLPHEHQANFELGQMLRRSVHSDLPTRNPDLREQLLAELDQMEIEKVVPKTASISPNARFGRRWTLATAIMVVVGGWALYEMNTQPTANEVAINSSGLKYQIAELEPSTIVADPIDPLNFDRNNIPRGYRVETLTRQVPVTKQRRETRTRNVPVTKYKKEFRSETLSDGSTVKKEVQVPYTEQVAQSYTVQVPYTENVPQTVEMLVPIDGRATQEDFIPSTPTRESAVELLEESTRTEPLPIESKVTNIDEVVAAGDDKSRSFGLNVKPWKEKTQQSLGGRGERQANSSETLASSGPHLQQEGQQGKSGYQGQQQDGQQSQGQQQPGQQGQLGSADFLSGGEISIDLAQSGRGSQGSSSSGQNGPSRAKTTEQSSDAYALHDATKPRSIYESRLPILNSSKLRADESRKTEFEQLGDELDVAGVERSFRSATADQLAFYERTQAAGKVVDSPAPLRFRTVVGGVDVAPAPVEGQNRHEEYFFRFQREKSGPHREYFRSLWGDQRSDSEQYEPINENQFIAAKGANALSTFSIDVDTAAYSNMRRFINNGSLPPADAVRIEELINYFDYQYPQPKGDDPFSVNMELATCPWNSNHKLLRVGLKGKEVHVDERPASNLVFLIDVSGSMNDPNKLPLLKRCFQMMVRELNENDRVSIVTYAGNAGCALEPTSGDQTQLISDAIERLTPGGSTHGSAGIELAYKLAQQNFIHEGVNKVVLATDGDLNVGITDDSSLVQLITNKASEGVFLTTLGFGTGNLKDSKLEKLADNGNGMYAYIDSIREGKKVLVDQLSGSLMTIAKDVKIQIEFNPAEVEAYRLIGYENRMLATKDFDDDQKDAGEIGAGHTVTALYELVTADHSPTTSVPKGLKYQSNETTEISKTTPKELTLSDAAKSGELLTLALRYKQPDENVSKRIEFTVKNDEKSFSGATDDFRFAAAVASFGMLVRGSEFAGEAHPGTVEEIASGAVGDDRSGYRAEFVDLVRKVRSIAGR